MTGYEEELVEDPELRGNTAALCNELLARCLVEPGADPSPARARVGALTSAERDLALVALRHKSFGGIVELVADCPSCGEGCGLSFDLGALPVELGDIVEELEVELPDGRARLRLPTAAEQAELVGLEIESAARRRTWLLAHVLITVAGRGGPFVEDDVHALPSASRRALERELSAALPEYDLAMDIDCQECGYQFESPFDIESFFLLS